MVDDDYKKRIESAVGKYLKKHEPRVSRKNEAPEREVVKKILQGCEENGWSVSVINSSSVYSEREDRYLTSQAPKGYPDVSGCTSLGVFAALEIKAPGKRSTMSDDQLEFLLAKISRGCFAGVFDSVDLLETTYLEWLKSDNKKSYLMRSLPRLTLREQKNDDGPLFPDEF
jgi:hypothetical protein